MKLKSFYDKAEIEVIYLASEDVISTSDFNFDKDPGEEDNDNDSNGWS